MNEPHCDIDATPPGVATMTVQLATPCCGTAISYASRREEPAPDGWLEESARIIAFMYADRMARHRCELVSEDNPLGLIPRNSKA